MTRACGVREWVGRDLNIVGLLAKRGAMWFGDEVVSGLDHALQCATLARAGGAGDEVVLAALLHDVGHLVSGAEESSAIHHGKWAARFLSPFVPRRVAWLVEHHVIAKRYLCTVDRAYAESLSLGSLRSWLRQGGPLDSPTCRALEREPWLSDVLAIRVEVVGHAHSTLVGAMCQISSAYWRIVRSLENFAMLATFRMDFVVHTTSSR